ncbi:MAG: TonB-dependent receptor [Gammaproteobacteria bacterium]|nr:TonB-dependent receptor [Gammaproteobacteria bacterium]
MHTNGVPHGAVPRILPILLFAAGAAGISIAADAPAPAAPAAPPARAAIAAAGQQPAEELETVIVTGSHIRKDQFTSAAPIQVIRRDESVLAGLVTSTEILQGSTVSGGGQQINNYFGGYVTDGGPGANTLSLRGLGAVRTLVLLNGRRLAPAGTRGSVGTADLNVLPSAIVDRYEILKDGASSIYGSDAVAGVVNIITRKGINDFTVEGQRVQTFEGGGNQTRISFVGGRTWDRFDLSGSIEVFDRMNLAVGQRDWAKCSTAEFFDPVSGDRAPGTMLDPTTGAPICFPISALTGTNGIARNYIVSPQYVFDPDIGDWVFIGNRWTPDASVAGPLPGWRNVDSAVRRPGFDPRMLNDSLISPTRNITAFLNGSYDLGRFGNAEAYFELLLARRDSKQIGSRQLSLDYQLDGDFNNHPFVPAEIYNGGGGVGFNPFGDLIIARALMFWGNDTAHQTGNFGRFVAGLRGDLPFLGDWGYDAYAMAGRSDASYTFESFLADRIYDSLYVTEVDPAATTDPTRTAGGFTYTCQVNVATPGTGCVPAPLLNAAFLAGTVDEAYRNYVWQPVTGHTTFDEMIFSAIADGSLFSLPHGKVRGAVGVEYRTDKFTDRPSEDSISDNLYNFTSAGITHGKDAVREVFAEIEAPLVRGQPLARDLTLNVSARYTDFNSYGSDETFKLGLNYEPFTWLKLRGTTGTSYRAPTIFEQYLAPTSGFLSGQSDPCYDYGNELPPGSTRYQNCASEGLPPDWLASSGVQVNSAGGAATGLSSENSRADTIGIVFQPTLSARVGGLALAIDWWRIKVTNEVAQLGAGILLQLCYDDPQFRAGGGYCAFSSRDVNNDLLVNDNYVNIATQYVGGLDYNLRYTRDIGLGELTVDLRATRYQRQDYRLLPADPLDRLNGTLTAPQWIGDADVKYEWKDWTFYYYLAYVDSMDSNEYVGVDPSVDPYDFKVSAYLTQNMSVRYASKNEWSVTLGVRNFTNAKPKTVSAGAYNRVGNSILYSGYDYLGASAVLTLIKNF